MTRRSRTAARRPMSAEEFAALAGIELEPLEFEADRRGAWTVCEHSQLKRQWRWVRRAPVLVQIIIALFALTWFMLWFFVTWLVVGGLMIMPAHGDSIAGQRNAEIAFCLDESNQRASRYSKSAIERVEECLRANGWLPNSGNPKVLDRDFVDRVNRAFTKDRR